MAIRKRIWMYNDSLPTLNNSYLTSNASNVVTASLVSDYIDYSSALFGSGNLFNYADMTSVTDYVIQAGDFLEYDIYWVDSGNIQMSMDFMTSDGSTLRDAGILDQNGLGAHPSNDLSSKTFQKWYHRKIPFTSFYNGTAAASSVGKTVTNFCLVAEVDTAGTKRAYIKNIVITDGKGNGVYNTENFSGFFG